MHGPGLGGIGSTKYLGSVVKDAGNESGLNPEKMPIVEVHMILKGHLAQHCHNEPFFWKFFQD